jgi:hypothetical protein
MPTAGPHPARSAPDALGRCKSCGRPIAFRETPSGALQPWDVDPGTGELVAVHFGTCPARRQAKREQRLREGKPADVPLDRCHVPACGALDLVYVAPTGAGGNGALWASRCQACGIHRYLPKAFDPPPGAIPAVAVPPGGPPRSLPPLRPWSRPEWDYAWGWRRAAGWGWWPRVPRRGGRAEPQEPAW